MQHKQEVQLVASVAWFLYDWRRFYM